MRALLAQPLLMLAASPALAAGAGNGSFSFAASLAQMLGALAVVVGLIYLLTYISSRWFKTGSAFKGRQGYIRIVETRHLAPKKSLMLVEVAGEYLLLSNDNAGVSLIKQVDMLEEVEVVEERGVAQAVRGCFQEKLDEMVARLQIPRPLLLASRKES